MNNSYFSKIYNIETETSELESHIIQLIKSKSVRRARNKRMIFGTISIFSLVGIVLSVIRAVKYMSESGAYEYISLIFSDTAALVHWREFAMTLAETIPFVSLTLIFGILAVFAWSLRNVFIQKINFKTA